MVCVIRVWGVACRPHGRFPPAYIKKEGVKVDPVYTEETGIIRVSDLEHFRIWVWRVVKEREWDSRLGIMAQIQIQIKFDYTLKSVPRRISSGEATQWLGIKCLKRIHEEHMKSRWSDDGLWQEDRCLLRVGNKVEEWEDGNVWEERRTIYVFLVGTSLQEKY